MRSETSGGLVGVIFEHMQQEISALRQERERLVDDMKTVFRYWMGPEFGQRPSDREMYSMLADFASDYLIDSDKDKSWREQWRYQLANKLLGGLLGDLVHVDELTEAEMRAADTISKLRQERNSLEHNMRIIAHVNPRPGTERSEHALWMQHRAKEALQELEQGR